MSEGDLAELASTISGKPSSEARRALSEAQVSGKVNSFGLSLLGSVHNTSGRSNVFISPLSLASTISLAALGTTTGGEAQHELYGALKLQAKAMPGFLATLHDITDRLTTAGDVELLSANSVWSQAPIRQAYVSKAKKMLGAEAKPLPREPAPINAWVKDHTQGMIPSIIDSLNWRTVNDWQTVAVLVNAVYFKGKWASNFNRARSALGTFHLADGVHRPCAMMKRVDSRMLYAEDGDLQLVELPYGEGRGVAATVLLPKRGGAVPLPELVRRLGWWGGAAALRDLTERLAPTHVSLQLPRFKLEFGVRDMVPELESAFGIREALRAGGQFRTMSHDDTMHLHSLLHKAVVDVDEEGTTAAAATAGLMWATRSVSMVPPKEVIVDRPFVFLIRDVRAGMVLFAGAVERPELDTSGL